MRRREFSYPLKIRRRLRMKNLVRIRVEGEKVVLEPVPDPLDIIKELVVKETEDVEREVRDFEKNCWQRAL